MSRLLLLRHAENLPKDEGYKPTYLALTEIATQRELLKGWFTLASGHPGHWQQAQLIGGEKHLGNFDEMGSVNKSHVKPLPTELSAWYFNESRRRGIDRAELFYDGSYAEYMEAWGKEGINCLKRESDSALDVVLVSHGVRLAAMLHSMLQVPLQNFKERGLHLKLGEGVLIDTEEERIPKKWVKLGRISEASDLWRANL